MAAARLIWIVFYCELIRGISHPSVSSRLLIVPLSIVYRAHKLGIRRGCGGGGREGPGEGGTHSQVGYEILVRDSWERIWEKGPIGIFSRHEI